MGGVPESGTGRQASLPSVACYDDILASRHCEAERSDAEAI